MPSRHIHYSPTQITAASGQVFGPSPNRVALILTPAAANDYSIAFGEDASLNRGIHMSQFGGPIIITRDLIGDDMLKGIFAVGTGTFSAPIAEIRSE